MRFTKKDIDEAYELGFERGNIVEREKLIKELKALTKDWEKGVIKMRYVIANINIQIPCPNAKTADEAMVEAENYELPKEYVEDSYEPVKVIKE